MKRRTKRKIYNKAKDIFQKTYCSIWVLSMYFAIAVHKFDKEALKFFLTIFIVTSFLAVPKLIIYFKVDKHRDELKEMMKRG